MPADDARWRELVTTFVFREGIGPKRKLAPNIYLNKSSSVGSYLDIFHISYNVGLVKIFHEKSISWSLPFQKGWELTFLIRAFGLSKKLSIKVGL